MKYVLIYKIKKFDTKLINLSDGQIECYKGPEEEYNDIQKCSYDIRMQMFG
jgi:hypothetical protein